MYSKRKGKILFSGIKKLNTFFIISVCILLQELLTNNPKIAAKNGNTS